jgi:hypothetical protein
MRNYFKTRAIRIYPYSPTNGQPAPDPDVFYIAFGGTDENLFKYQVLTQQFLLTVEPTYLFFVSAPAVIWFELNLENFSKLLNQASGQIWSQTRANTGPFPPDQYHELLYDMTAVEQEGSPRSTWSHGV